VLSNYCLDSDSLTYNAGNADYVSRSFAPDRMYLKIRSAVPGIVILHRFGSVKTGSYNLFNNKKKQLALRRAVFSLPS